MKMQCRIAEWYIFSEFMSTRKVSNNNDLYHENPTQSVHFLAVRLSG